MVCFALLLFPQIFLNQARRSTEGLSLSLVLLWHASAVLIIPYLLYLDETLPLLLQWAVFALASVLLELQFYTFRKGKGGEEGGEEQGMAVEELEAVVVKEEGDKWEERMDPQVRKLKTHATSAPSPSSFPSSPPAPPTSSPTPFLHLLLQGLALLLLTVGSVIALLSLFNAVRSSTSGAVFIKVVGSGIASLLLAVGFLPQLVLMCKTRSSQGLSLGLPLLDVTGSSLSILVLCLEAKEEGDDVNVGGVVPYAIIVGFQVGREEGMEGGREGRCIGLSL